MRIRCPHCHNAIKVVEEWSATEVECTHCGSVFTLVDDDATKAHLRSGTVIAHFQLVDKLGQGSFGTVWKARDTHLDRFVAVKIPRRDETDPEQMQSFLREARAAAQLNHDLETICLKCLEKEPQRRFATCQEIADELSRFLRGLPIHSRPVSKFVHLYRWAKRKPSQAAFSTAALLLVTLLSVGGPLIAFQQSRIATQQTMFATQQAQLLSERQAANLHRIESQVELLSTIDDSQAVDVIVDSFRSDSDLVIPVLRKDLERNSDSKARIRSAATLIKLAGPTPELRRLLIDEIPNANSSESHELIGALLLDPDRQAVSLLLTDRLQKGNLNSTVANRYVSTLVHLGDFSRMESVLVLSNGDASERTRFIHAFAKWTGDFKLLADALQSVREPVLQSGLCLALGTVDPNEVTATPREKILACVRDWNRNSASGKTHSACKWLLRTWAAPLPEIAPNAEISEDEWYITKTELTMVHIPAGPVLLGQGTESLKYHIEINDAVVEQDFWMSDFEISKKLFSRFVNDPDYPEDQKPADFKIDEDISPFDDCPVQSVTFEDALLFCNWLSRQEGKAVCYRKTDVVVDLSKEFGIPDLPKVALWESRPDSDGFRLPSFVESELAMRAGTTTAFFFGDSMLTEFLPHYAC